MDYLIFLTGLFLLAAAAACLFFFHQDRRISRWPLLALALTALGCDGWFDILVFAHGLQAAAMPVHAALIALAAAALLGFRLSPADPGPKSAAILKWAAVGSLGALTFTVGLGYSHTAGFIAPLLVLTFAGAWQIPAATTKLMAPTRSAPAFVVAFLLTVVAAACLMPGAVGTCYDVNGMGSSPARILRLGAIAAATACAIAFCGILWSVIYQKYRGQLSRNLIRRRRLGSVVLLTSALFTLGNGAGLTQWLGNQSQQKQTSTLLSGLHLGANNLDPDMIGKIQGLPAEIGTANYAILRTSLIQIREALPGTRFCYLLGTRNRQLVFLVDAEDPANKETFSPPGQLVKDYPEKWHPALAGSSTFLGPYLDEWGVWFSAVVPISDSNHRVVALLSVDYPAAKWLEPTAARRLAAMVMTLSVAVLLMVLFGFHLLSINTARNLESLSEYLSDVMQSVPCGLAVVSAEGRISYANPAFQRLARCGSQSLVNHPLDSLISITGSPPRANEGTEVTLTGLDGSITAVQVFRASLAAALSKADSILAIVDLTSTKKAEQSLIRSRAVASRLALVAKRTDNAVVITDPDGLIEWVNEGFTKISGYTKAEAIGRKPGSFLQRPHDNPVERNHMRECVQAGLGFETEIINYRKSGHSYIIHIECQPLADPNGKLTGFMAIERDVTQIRRTTNLLEAMASINTMLLSKRLEPSVWGGILAALGTAANADRCYIFQIHPHPVLGTPAMSQSAEWNSGSATAQMPNPELQNFSFHENGYGRWLTELLAGHVISGTVPEFPPAEQPMLIAQEIRSLVVVPIFTGDQLTGFMGFDACLEDRTWENWEITILRSAAANIGLHQVVRNEADALVLARDEACQAAITAEKANRAKSTFLATMSHEIRTPLNAVIGMASLLETTSLNSQQQDFIETILHSGNFLLDLITDILDYSRIESGSIDLALAPFSLAELCRTVFDVVRPGAAGKQLEFIGQLAPHLPAEVMGDRARISQILVNLLSNAVKFTPSGFISLIVDGHQGNDGLWHLTFEVRDSGIGIAPEVITRMFQPFIQADSSTTRRFGGSGLGLAISKRLAECMGGDITIQSASGQGSTFLTSLTLQPAPPPASATPASPRLPEPQPLTTLIVDDNEAERIAKLKVLVAEDNPNNQKVIRLLLRRLGIDADIAGDGQQALAAARAAAYDIIFLDLQMPVMDGLEASRRIRALDAAQRPVIIALTANAFMEDRATASAAGMDDYLAKPITLDSLRAMISQVMARMTDMPITDDPADPGLTDHAPPPELLDDLIIDTLAIFGIEGYQEVLHGVITTGATYMEDIHAAIEQGDAITLKKQLHAFRGMLLQFGLAAMPARLWQLEADPPAPAQAAAIRSELQDLWQRSLAAVKQWEQTVPDFAT